MLRKKDIGTLNFLPPRIIVDLPMMILGGKKSKKSIYIKKEASTGRFDLEIGRIGQKFPKN